jgi:hypothetical protein
LQAFVAKKRKYRGQPGKFARLAAFLACFCWLIVASAIVQTQDSQIEDNRRMRLQIERETQNYQITTNTAPIEELQRRLDALEAKKYDERIAC